MKEIIQRFKAETPVFFKKIRNVSISIASASTAMSIYYSQIPEKFAAFIPEHVVSSIATAGFIAAVIAQLTKKDNNEPAKVETPNPVQP